MALWQAPDSWFRTWVVNPEWTNCVNNHKNSDPRNDNPSLPTDGQSNTQTESKTPSSQCNNENCNGLIPFDTLLAKSRECGTYRWSDPAHVQCTLELKAMLAHNQRIDDEMLKNWGKPTDSQTVTDANDKPPLPTDGAKDIQDITGGQPADTIGMPLLPTDGAKDIQDITGGQPDTQTVTDQGGGGENDDPTLPPKTIDGQDNTQTENGNENDNQDIPTISAKPHGKPTTEPLLDGNDKPAIPTTDPQPDTQTVSGDENDKPPIPTSDGQDNTPKSCVDEWISAYCSPDEEEYAVEVESKVAEIDDYARSHGYEETDKRLQHWLDGSGTPLPLNVDSLTQTESVQKAIDTNHDRFISNNYFTSQIDPSRGTSILVSATSLEDGQSIPFHDKWDRVISYSDELRNGNIDLLGSVGNTQISSDGDFRITKNGNLYTVTGTVIHTIKDVYNFNPGDTFYIP